MKNSSLQNQLRESDYERYILSIFAPQDSREKLFALYCFNDEIAKVFDLVSDPMNAFMRFAWWKDNIKAVHNGNEINDHPILNQLKDDILNDSNNHFTSVIEARESEFNDGALQKITEFELYIEKSSVAIMNLALSALDCDNDEIFAIAREIGYSWGIAGILSAAHIYIPTQRLIFPEELLEKHHISYDNYGSDSFKTGFSELARELGNDALERIKHARELARKLPRNELKKYISVLLHANLAEHKLLKLKNNNYEALNLTMAHNMSPMTMLRLYINASRGKF